MTPEEKASAKKISRIMRSARKHFGLTQEEVSKKLGISQSALSKLEHGTLIPSAPQWFDFCDLVQIPTNCLKSGLIDRKIEAELEDGPKKGSFKIPRKYGVQRGSKVRALLPFLKLLRETLGEKRYYDFFEEHKMDADYFVDLDHMISIEFLFDVVRTLIQEGALKPNQMETFTKLARDPENHGVLRERYDGVSSKAELIKNLISNSRFYECNFKYEIANQSASFIDIAVSPEAHLERISIKGDPLLGDFVWEYKRSYFEQFLNYGKTGQDDSKPSHRVERLNSSDGSKNQVVYRVSL